jgi:UDP:flavonoid glycosyltransferase YjiC (YdhE family)
MATILIWMSPEQGHILPTIKISRDLVRRGHRVVYLVPAGTSADIRRLGLEATEMFSGPDRLVVRSSLFGPPQAARSFYEDARRGYPDFLEALNAELTEAAVRNDAELVLVDGVLEERFPLLEPHDFLRPFAKVARVFPQLPFARVRTSSMSLEKAPVIFLSPVEFELPHLRLPGAAYTEPGVFENTELTEFPWDRLDPGRQLVYCSFGTQMDEYEGVRQILGHVMEAAKRLPGCQVVVNAGSQADEWHSSDDVLVVRAVYPQLPLLRRCAVMITNGGFGTLKDCILAGVHPVVIPMRWDQGANATRVIHHGVGLALSKRSTSPEAIASLVTCLLEPGPHKESLRALQAVFVLAQAGTSTADLCESLLNQ